MNHILFTSTIKLLSLTLLLAFSTSVASSSTSSNLPVRHHVTENGWQYDAFFDRTSGVINARSDFQWNTAASAVSSVAAHRRMAGELIRQGFPLEGTVVFRRPLSQTEFELFVAATEMEVVDYTMRYVNELGQRVTIFGTPSPEALVRAVDLEFALRDLTERDPGDFKGWIEVRGIVPSAGYNILKSDPNVFIFDVTRAVVRTAFEGEPEIDGATLELVQPQAYWLLEDLGLAETE
jgi:hypothetical protein